MEILAAIVLFGSAMAAMSVGVIFSDRELKGSCGGIADLEHDHDLGCGACARNDADLCPSDEPLVKIAQIGHPNPKHHRY